MREVGWGSSQTYSKKPTQNFYWIKKKVLKEENMTKPQLQSPPALNLFKFRPKVYLTRVKKKKKKGCWSYYKRLVSRGSCCADTKQLQACCSLAVSTAAPEANAEPLISLRILSCGVKEVWSNHHSLSQNLSLKKDLKNCANVPKGRDVSSNEHCYKRCCGENLLGVCYRLPDFIFTLILPHSLMKFIILYTNCPEVPNSQRRDIMLVLKLVGN